ncbi:hypothetical protein [Morganella morganii]|uniref:hypothetical protein n=1 Tax=Morganella morganii TaxID=582 RepID=UPI003EC05CDE
MKLKDETLVDEFKNITTDDAVRVFKSTGKDIIRCPLCDNWEFTFVIQEHNQNNLVPFCLSAISDNDDDEHSVFYKMICLTCSNEMYLNAYILNKKLKELSDEQQ